MTATRSRKQSLSYKKYLKRPKANNHCEFCTLQASSHLVETDSFVVIRNIFPYSLWDNQGVADHLLIVPRIHIFSAGELHQNALTELHRLIATYEREGYNIYLRSATSSAKTVGHQHTHLIKLDNKIRRLIFLSRKPYIRLIV